MGYVVDSNLVDQYREEMILVKENQKEQAFEIEKQLEKQDLKKNVGYYPFLNFIDRNKKTYQSYEWKVVTQEDLNQQNQSVGDLHRK